MIVVGLVVISLSVLSSEVFKARNRKTNSIVALKKVRMENEKEGVSINKTRFARS